jgi:hypothetical protein
VAESAPKWVFLFVAAQLKKYPLLRIWLLPKKKKNITITEGTLLRI